MDGIGAKLGRSRDHLADLEEAVAEYLARKPYSLEVQNDLQANERRLLVRVREEPPPALALMTGDVVHNARAALDHLACRLVEHRGGVVARATCFPVTDREGGWGDVARKSLRGITVADRAAIRQLAPWREGNPDLWRLHHLDILDKHRLLMVVLARHTGIMFGGGQWRPFPDDPEDVIEIPQFVLNAADQEPVHDGYVGFTMPLDTDLGPLGSPDGLPNVVLDLALWQEEGAPGDPLVPLLRRVVDAAEHAIAHVRSTCALT